MILNVWNNLFTLSNKRCNLEELFPAYFGSGAGFGHDVHRFGNHWNPIHQNWLWHFTQHQPHTWVSMTYGYSKGHSNKSGDNSIHTQNSQCYKKCAEEFLHGIIPAESSHQLQKRQVGPIIRFICKFAKKIPWGERKRRRTSTSGCFYINW